MTKFTERIAGKGCRSTGRSATPGIYETLAVLGKQRSVGRIATAIQYVRRA